MCVHCYFQQFQMFIKKHFLWKWQPSTFNDTHTFGSTIRYAIDQREGTYRIRRTAGDHQLIEMSVKRDLTETGFDDPGTPRIASGSNAECKLAKLHYDR